MSRKTLFYFTESFPYGLGEMWKFNELRVFREHFNEITVVPFGDGGNFTRPKRVPEGVRVETPLFRDSTPRATPAALARLLAHRHAPYHLREGVTRRVFLNRHHAASWLSSAMRIERLLGHPTIQRIMHSADRNTVLFFFWGLGACDIVPFLPRGANRPLTAARMHRYDLFEYAARGYMPYRRPLLNALSYAFPSSQSGVDHLRRHYPQAKAQIQVGRMGVVGEGRSEVSTDGTLRILTCSYLKEVKRVHLVAEALGRLDFPVHWTHLGDGPLRPDLERRIASLPAHIAVKLEGMIDSTTVLSYYKQHPIDLFINVSSSEGVPFSIMEAFSAGIPVAATDVGGTAEIVDDGVGRILPADVDASVLARMLREFAARSPAQRLVQRDAAFRRYEERCDANRLSRAMAELLTGA